MIVSSVSLLHIVDIEKQLGISEPVTDSRYSLPKWYERIRSKTIGDLTDGDLARLLRQNMYVEFIFPEVLERLESKPLIGELYDGELITALSILDPVHWGKSDVLTRQLLNIIDSITVNGQLRQGLELPSDEEESQIIESLTEIRKRIGGVE